VQGHQSQEASGHTSKGMDQVWSAMGKGSQEPGRLGENNRGKSNRQEETVPSIWEWVSEGPQPKLRKAIWEAGNM
jgi:hypothetical protein